MKIINFIAFASSIALSQITIPRPPAIITKFTIGSSAPIVEQKKEHTSKNSMAKTTSKKTAAKSTHPMPGILYTIATWILWHPTNS